jgi:error-prone DNA polymerase
MIQGRGSAANSAVCFVLGITAVDPVRMDLLFERFLSEERVAAADNATDRMPDIDLDLPSGDRRELVIQHVYEKYGARGAAMTANVITYRPRMAVRDAGRALGLAEEQLNRIARHLPHWLQVGDDTLETHLAAAGFPPTERRNRLIAEAARGLLNLPRHLGQHSGGMVIAAGRLDAVVPLEPASMPGGSSCSGTRTTAPTSGIVKVDLLGLGMMAVLEEPVPLIPAPRGRDGRLREAARRRPEGLRHAARRRHGRACSRSNRARRWRRCPRYAADPLLRPGRRGGDHPARPIVGKMVNPYLARRNGRERVTYPHPSLEPILKRTAGRAAVSGAAAAIAMTAAGFTGGQADELRRAMGSSDRRNG